MPVSPVLYPMTTASTELATFTVGVYAPADFPEDDIRAVLGVPLSFWHDDADAALEACRLEAPDLLVLCAHRLGGGLLEFVAALSEVSEETSPVLICDRSGASEVRKALDAGIRGLVPLRDLESALLPVIEVVRVGQVSVPDSRNAELRQPVLTAREKQILGLVVMGMTNAEIATKLFLAESTIKSHLSSAFAKLGVASRNEAAALILDPASRVGLGILTIPSQALSAPR